MLVWIKDTLIVFIALLAPLWIVAGLNYSGFCWEQKRWLSEEEKIHRAIVDRFVSSSNYRVQVAHSVGDTLVEKENLSTPYSSFEDFISANPNCCSLNISESADSGPPTFWTKVKGGYSDTAVIHYGKAHRTFDGSNPSKSVSYIDNCGRTVKPW